MRQGKLFEHFKPTAKKRKAVDSDDEAARSSESDVGNIDFEENAASDDEEDDEAESPRRPSPTKNKKRRITTPPATSSPPADPADGSPRVSGSRKAKSITVVDSDDDERPRTSRLRRGPPPEPEVESDDSDALDQSNVLESRLRRPGQAGKSTRAAALERLLRKRRKRKQGSDASKSESEEDQDEDEDEDDEDEDPDRPFDGAKPTDEYDSNSEGSVEDFIVDDGGQAGVALPSQFRAQQPLSHHFKIIFQYFVHMICAPNRGKFVKLNRKTEYFVEALSVMRRKLSGIQDSLVTSSVWRNDFKNALRTYPELTLETMTFSLPTCDACHIGGRVSTIVGHLGGSRYNTQTHENIPEPEPDEDEDDNSTPLPMTFHLGRFCARRTRVFHQYAHWEHDLYSAIELRVRNVDDHETKTPDEIVALLDGRGVVDFEWKRMNELIESAQKLEVAAKRGEDNDIE